MPLSSRQAEAQSSSVCILTTNSLFQLIFIYVLVSFTSVVPMKYFCSDFDLRVIRHKFFRNLNSVHNFNSCAYNSIVFHITHRNKVVNLRHCSEKKYCEFYQRRDEMINTLDDLPPKKCKGSGINAWKRVSCT